MAEPLLPWQYAAGCQCGMVVCVCLFVCCPSQAPSWVTPQYGTSSTDEGQRSESLEGHVFAPVSLSFLISLPLPPSFSLSSSFFHSPSLPPSLPQCPHSLQCPLAESGSVPCHFGQRVMLDFCDVSFHWQCYHSNSLQATTCPPPHICLSSLRRKH